MADQDATGATTSQSQSACKRPCQTLVHPAAQVTPRSASNETAALAIRVPETYHPPRWRWSVRNHDSHRDIRGREVLVEVDISTSMYPGRPGLPPPRPAGALRRSELAGAVGLRPCAAGPVRPPRPRRRRRWRARPRKWRPAATAVWRAPGRSGWLREGSPPPHLTPGPSASFVAE